MQSVKTFAVASSRVLTHRNIFDKLLGIVGILMLISYGVSNLLVFPEIALSIMAVTYIFYIPYGIGTIILRLCLAVPALRRYLTNLRFSDIIVRWMVGLLLITISVLAFPFAIKSGIDIIGPLLILASTVGCFLTLDIKRPKESSVTYNKTITKIIIIGLLIGFSFGIYVRSFSPYPLTPGVDIFTHIFTAKNVLSGTPELSPVVYIPSIDILIAIASQTYGAELVGIFWTGSIFLYALFAVSVYFMIFWLLRNNSCAFVGTVIALSITEMGKVANLQFFYPSGFLMSFFPVIFFVVESFWKRVKDMNQVIPAIIFTGVVLGGMLVIHLQIAIVASIVIVIYLAARFLVKKSPFVLFGLRVATISLTIIIMLLFLGISTFQLEYFPIVDRLIFQYEQGGSTELKVRDLNDWYTSLIVVVALAGIIILSLFEDNKRVIVIGFIAALLLWTYFQQFSHIQRTLVLERPLLAFATSVCAMLPFYTMSRISVYLKHRKQFSSNIRDTLRSINKVSSLVLINSFNDYLERYDKLKIIYVLLVVLILFPTLMGPYDLYFSVYLEKGYDFVNFTNEEVVAGRWIEQNTPTNLLIYSDPSTVLEMRGLGFRGNIEGIGWNTTVANEVKSVLDVENSSRAHDSIISNVGRNVLIVITPRTSEWVIKNSDNFTDTSDIQNFYVQWPVNEFKQFGGLDKFFDIKYFDLLYDDDNTLIFKPV